MTGSKLAFYGELCSVWGAVQQMLLPSLLDSLLSACPFPDLYTAPPSPIPLWWVSCSQRGTATADLLPSLEDSIVGNPRIQLVSLVYVSHDGSESPIDATLAWFRHVFPGCCATRDGIKVSIDLYFWKLHIHLRTRLFRKYAVFPVR